MSAKPVTMWALRCPGLRNLNTGSIHRTKGEVIEWWLNHWAASECRQWAHWYRKGFRVRRVLVQWEPTPPP